MASVSKKTKTVKSQDKNKSVDKKASAQPTKASRSVKKPKKSAHATAVKKTQSKKVSVRKPGVAKKRSIKPSGATSLSSTKKAENTTKSDPKSKRASATKSRKKKSSTENTQKRPRNKDTISLPNRMSIRAREKALLFHRLFSTDLHRAMTKIAFVSGVSFVFIGGVAALSEMYGSKAFVCDTSMCQASLPPAVTQEVTQVSADQPIATPTTLNPSFVVLGAVPNTVESEHEIPLEITAVEDISAYVQIPSQLRTKESVAVQERPNNKYIVQLQADTLSPGTYAVIVNVKYTGEVDQKRHNLGSFTIPPSNVTNALELESSQPDFVSLEPDATVELESDTQSQDEQTDETISTSPVVTSTTTEESDDSLAVIKRSNERAIDTLTTDSASGGVDTEYGVSLDLDTDEQAAPPNELQKTSPVLLTVPEILSGPVTFRISSDETIQNTVYTLRRIQTASTQQIGRVVGDVKSFTFNSSQYPNGPYDISARVTLISGEVVRVAPQRVRINNQQLVKITENNENTVERPILTISEAFADEEPTVDNPISNATSSPVLDSRDNMAQNPETESDAIADVARERLNADTEELSDLLANLSAARQSGNEQLIRAAESALDTYRATVVAESLRDENDRFIASDLNIRLQEKIENASTRIERFETVRKDRSNTNSAIDTDGDGISDLDEQVLFKTDPTNADTDGDGFVDGVEIVRGFDPLSDEVEAVIEYESPKETLSVVVTESLQVETVSPEIIITPETEQEQVNATVRGRGLPNSFVTLYVFSTPTIVTVKTDETGAFEYTFTKELEDGEHQVFVALTDNTGEIVAQSAPFRFIKEAQAFTPVNAAEAAPQQPFSNQVTDQRDSFTIVIGMSVLALGILLILLGVGLRSNKPETLAT